MISNRLQFGLLGLAAILLQGCNLPGRPGPGPEVPRPEAVTSFDTLYSQNCAGCHGATGEHGAATDLANPEYEAFIDDASLRDVIANGRKGTLMPGFGVHGGGSLADNQIDALVQGMRARWRKEDAFAGQTPPVYKATSAGDPSKGQAVYNAACARCHGASAQQPGPSGSILDGAFLGLIDPQMVRTTIVAGRPDVGQPDWRGLVPGHVLTDAEVTDVTAWLLAQKPVNPGQPYPDNQPASVRPGEDRSTAVKKTTNASPQR